ncbi:hypothetical protein [Sphingobacterium pedocola]|uniref:hypothetical protein n=1 Tax=Sphingobacterium pedocola TaxID=2082722 RepID=UPI0018C9EDFE|nr:hypothetical protein [Sphingobacterium pedocola]
MINKTVITSKIDEHLINFNGPEDDSEDVYDDDFDLEIDSVSGFDDFDEDDEDF